MTQNMANAIVAVAGAFLSASVAAEKAPDLRGPLSTAEKIVDRQIDSCVRTDPSISACTRLLKWGAQSKSALAIAFYYRATGYDAQKRYARAITDYSKAIVLAPHDANAFLGRGNDYQAQKAYVRAIADYTRAIRLNPKNTAALKNRGSTYDDEKRYIHAIADYTDAIRLNPRDAGAFLNRGVVYDHQHDYARAIADYDQAIRLNPRYSDAFNS